MGFYFYTLTFFFLIVATGKLHTGHHFPDETLTNDPSQPST